MPPEPPTMISFQDPTRSVMPHLMTVTTTRRDSHDWWAALWDFFMSLPREDPTHHPVSESLLAANHVREDALPRLVEILAAMPSGPDFPRSMPILASRLQEAPVELLVYFHR